MTDAVRRLRAAAGRLRAAAGRVEPARRTAADPATGEQWEAGQVLSHCAEMIPYWVGEIDQLVASGGSVAFGRVKSDPQRIERIAAGRQDETGRQLDAVDGGVDAVERLLGTISTEGLRLVGHHSTLGSMTVAEIVQEFLVDHLQQHAAQLETLGGSSVTGT